MCDTSLVLPLLLSTVPSAVQSLAVIPVSSSSLRLAAQSRCSLLGEHDVQVAEAQAGDRGRPVPFGNDRSVMTGR